MIFCTLPSTSPTQRSSWARASFNDFGIGAMTSKRNANPSRRISRRHKSKRRPGGRRQHAKHGAYFSSDSIRSEEHTSELQSLMRISYAVFCLKKKKKK